MICQKCNKEIGNNRFCPYCGQDNSISVMSEQEKDDYGGVTIEEKNNRIHGSYTRPERQYSSVFRFKGGSSWFSRIVWGLVILAVAAFVVFVALPFISIAFLSVLVIWAVFKLLN